MSMSVYVTISIGYAYYSDELQLCGQGSCFSACPNSEGVLLGAKRARRCCFASCCLSKAAPETKLPGSWGQSRASEWNVPSWFKVQPPEPEGPRDHLRPSTHAPSILLPTSLRFHLRLPALLSIFCCVFCSTAPLTQMTSDRTFKSWLNHLYVAINSPVKTQSSHMWLTKWVLNYMLHGTVKYTVFTACSFYMINDCFICFLYMCSYYYWCTKLNVPIYLNNYRN